MSTQGWVAVIDDDASVRRSVGRVLSVYGVRVETYGSAEEYLERRAVDVPRCIVADVQLAGGMSGLELLSRLASDEAGSPPFILMTGLDLPNALIRVRGGSASWLCKPFDAARLMALVLRHMKQEVSQLPPSHTAGLRRDIHPADVQ